MERPPRIPGTKIADRAQTIRWVIGGLLIAGPALLILQYGPDKPSTTVGTVSMTMAFVVVALAGVNNGLVMRREREPWWSAPLFPYMGWVILGWFLTLGAVEFAIFQRLLTTVSLTGGQWAIAIALSLISPLFVAIDKTIQTRRAKG
jgi:Ca2+-transporting ATPase